MTVPDTPEHERNVAGWRSRADTGAMAPQAIRRRRRRHALSEKWSLHPGRCRYALAPVYARRPRFQNARDTVHATAVATRMSATVCASTRPAIARAGTVTAIPTGMTVDIVMRSQPG